MYRNLCQKVVGALCACCMLCALLCGPAGAAEEAAAGPSVSAELSSLSAVLYEPTGQRVLYEKDAHTRRAIASTTKLMTALLAAENLCWDDTVTVPDEAVRVEGTSLGLRGGDTLSVRDLVTGLLLVSGNDAANAIALAVSGSLPAFAERMNARAAEIGMADTLFVTPSGLDEGDNGSSAYDMALLAAEVLKNPVLAEICAMQSASVVISGRKTTVTNHNRLLQLYPDAVGMKTGYTKKSGKCLVSAARRDGVLLIAVTLNGGDYWNDHMKLYEAGFGVMQAVELPLPALPALPVSGGTAGSVRLGTQPADPVVIPRDESAQVETKLELPAFLWAPVEAGQTVGTVRYYLNGQEVGASPVTAMEAVESRAVAGFSHRFWENFWAMVWELLG